MNASRCSLLFASFAMGVAALLTTGCHAQPKPLTTNSSLPNTAAPYLVAQGANVMRVQVGGAGLCGQFGYLNEPCTEVTICVPGTRQCQTISDVLVDTGSIGLRIFSSVVTLPLPAQAASDGGRLAECAQFGTSGTWGPLSLADVVLAGEPAVTAPIQLIDAGYGQAPKGCTNNVDSAPKMAGYNGILGVGLFKQDCGQGCVTTPANGAYYSCSGGCTAIAAPNGDQLVNVVALLPQDGNGFVLALPQIDSGGAAQVNGVLILGLDTQANNSLAGLSAHAVDARGNFTTSYQGHSYPSSYIDSGSNALFFPDIFDLPVCASRGPGSGVGSRFYCPTSPTTLTVANGSTGESLQTRVEFTVANTDSLVAGASKAFNDFAGVNAAGFDWGLPFFYGRAVAFGIETRHSSQGTGPMIAY